MKFNGNHALAICWRVFVVLLVLISILSLTAWALLPDINRMRPQIESLLKQQLQLRELKLKNLSWYWAGHLGFKAKQCTFSTSDEALSIQQAQLDVAISLAGMIQGELWPKRIDIHGGSIQLDMQTLLASPSTALPPTHIILNDMQLTWKYLQYHGVVEGFAMNIDLFAGQGRIQMPGLLLQGQLDQSGFPIAAFAHFDNEHGIPLFLQSYIQGKVSGDIAIKALAGKQWQLDLKVLGDQASVELPRAPFDLPFDQLLTSSVMTLNDDGSLKDLEVSDLQWLSGHNQAIGSAVWKDGVLALDATSKHVDMPLLWSWLRPLSAEKSWHDWLARMQAGVASDVKVGLKLPWLQPLAALPNQEDWQGFHYRVQANVQDADINLGRPSDTLLHMQGRVDLNEHGLHADIDSVDLPFNVGSGHGVLDIPWHSLLINVQAQGDVDVVKLQHWFSTGDTTELYWEKAPALAAFHMQWNPDKTQPESANIILTPKETWHLKPENLDISVDSGQVEWDFKKGLNAKDLIVHGRFLHGKLSFHAIENALNTWQLKALNADIQGDMLQLANYYNFPIEAASGHLNMHISFNKTWSGNIDLQQAAWNNFLGASKVLAEPLQIHYEGTLIAGNDLNLTHLSCKSSKLQLSGHGYFNAHALKLSLDKLKTPAFDGALNIVAPFGQQPWEMDLNAVYLDRKALPKRLPSTKTLSDKSWSLRAKIDTFVWDAAKMSGVTMQLASKRNSVGVFKAAVVDTGSFTLQDVAALFALPGEGRVDLRQLSAQMGQEKLMLSASLKPELGGGMRWKGFAQLQGNFGQMMQRAELTSLFADGDMQAIFLGQGVLLREQPWWDGLRGRLRLRVNDGTILKGGTLTKTLAAVSLTDLPALFFGKRDDLTKAGIYYKRLQIEGQLYDDEFSIHELALRSSAMDIAGKGKLNLASNNIDFTMVVRPFQNLDALLAKVPLVRDLLGGQSYSLMRKIYHMSGPVANAEVNELSTKQAGLSSPGLIESLFSLPKLWFGDGVDTAP